MAARSTTSYCCWGFDHNSLLLSFGMLSNLVRAIEDFRCVHGCIFLFFSCNSHGILVWKPENAILGSGQKRMCASFPSVLDSCEILAKLVAILEVIPGSAPLSGCWILPICH
jgi:hypothetical protein